MEQFKSIARYWRDSLIDKQFSKGKFRPADLVKSFLPNDRNMFLRVNSKRLIHQLLPIDDRFTEISYIPFSFHKTTSHNKHVRDYRPEILFPIIFKVQVSENGFIYPVEKPIIPRDLLLPLDQEDFSIGHMDDYDLFMTKHDIPVFEYSEASAWEVYYAETIESEYRDGLTGCLLEASLISEEASKGDYKNMIKSLLNRNKLKNQFTEVSDRYTDEWDDLIESKLTDDSAFKKAIEPYIKKWKAYIKIIDDLLKCVVVSKEIFDGYEQTHAAYFTNGELDISSKITAVYEDLFTSDKKPGLQLFRNYTTTDQEQEKPVIDASDYFAERLGHNNDLYPLAEAQRTAVSALLGSKDGDILPVNGPPGTGKTTMLLSVVACLWVKHAVNELPPPVIIANSTNNQAVTNIIDSFEKDFSAGKGDFAGRWIDGIGSFGSYFVSSMRSSAAREKGYITEDAIKEMETEHFYNLAAASFLEKARKVFHDDTLTVKASVRELHQLLSAKESILRHAAKTYNAYHQSGTVISNISGVDYKDKEAVKRFGASLADQKNELDVIEEKWERHLASESIFLSSLSFLPFVKERRNLKAKLFAKANDFSRYLPLDDPDADSLLSEIKHLKAMVCENIQRLEAFDKARDKCNDVLSRLGVGMDADADFTAIDKKADTGIRFEMFLIATHYWEGRWLLEMEELIENGRLDKIDWKYGNIIENNWRRRMKITPCAVMTSYMLPNYFYFSRKIHDQQRKVDYLYDFIDLLIVDEAGQVPPEVAGAGFSLAKKALVIGDTLQIPPISKLTKSIDIGNLVKAGLLPANQGAKALDEAYISLQSKGVAADGGSVMRIAQNRSPFFPEKQLERGLYLYEHRRCYDNIIAFCNELCYKGVLKPMRGAAKADALLPSMGYLNIEGMCRNVSGSRQNELEAKIIAGWIITNYTKLRNAYDGQEIKDIVAVVTPFRQQSLKIADFLKAPKDKSIKDALSQITVGTVHSLQGAERKVVVFSPTYSRHNRGSFIDNDKSMLNVAVSRAKDCFLVFGDMSLVDRQSASPTGILAKYLFEYETNALSYIHQYSKMFARDDLVSDDHPVGILTDYEAHDRFLKQVFNDASQRIIIISPWLIYDTIVKNGYDQLLSGNRSQITIYTDDHFNTYRQNRPDKHKTEAFQETVNKLNELGVRVIVKNNIHSKIVIKDNDTLCIGSFNWFSAQRGGPYANTEHSVVYQGDGVREEIESLLMQLQ